MNNEHLEELGDVEELDIMEILDASWEWIKLNTSCEFLGKEDFIEAIIKKLKG